MFQIASYILCIFSKSALVIELTFATAALTYLYVSGLVEGVVIALEEKANKNNSSFINMTVSDGETQVVAKVRNADLETFKFKTGQAVLVELKMEEYKGQKSYVAREITPSSADPALFICGAPVKSEEMYNFLYKTAGRCGVYASTVKKILDDNKDHLMFWGAGKAVHHNIRGGLLYHTYRMTKTAAYITSVYNKEPSMLKGCRDINTEHQMVFVVVKNLFDR